MRHHDDRGQVTLLILGFTTIVLLLLAVVTDASKAYLVRRDLSQLADGAALAGTRGVSSTINTGDTTTIDLSRQAAETEVTRYLASASTTYEDLTATVTVTGPEVTVHLQATIDLPLGIPGAGNTVTVRSEGSSVLATR